MRFPRSFYIPAKSCQVSHRRGLAVAYIYANAKGAPCAVAFIGKASKPAIQTAYATVEGRSRAIATLFSNLDAHEARKIEQRKAGNAGHTLKVGDIITNSWGYDQTNVDWYRITRTSKNFVWLQPIAGCTTDASGPMSGYSVPGANLESADPQDWKLCDLPKPVLKRKAERANVSMKFGSGQLWDGKAKYESWYA